MSALFIRLAAIGTVFLATAAFGQSPQWAYVGDAGAENWGTLSADWAVCAAGNQQSPIDLTGAVAADPEDVIVNWNPATKWAVVNNGHTIQANATDGGFATIGTTQYALLQFHFHAPSEHAIDEARSAMEVHFVHQAKTGALAVIGAMIQGGGKNELFEVIMTNAPKSEGEAPLGKVDGRALLPENTGNGGFMRYQGSLTTPPCSETVLWTVLTDPITVSDAAIAAFTAIYDMNARPLQPVNRRFILTE